ncbi:hypothetical protein CW304_18875 [Bacillus sp. UFRGS-B20]|nr:hypothetical protein CW304_18875 [Bacillus sp. UFRGS-B20]
MYHTNIFIRHQFPTIYILNNNIKNTIYSFSFLYPYTSLLPFSIKIEIKFILYYFYANRIKLSEFYFIFS